MTVNWTEIEAGNFWDGYLDWTRLLHSRRARPVGDMPYEPIFVALTSPSKREALFELVTSPDPAFRMEAGELARLHARLNGDDSDGVDEYPLYHHIGADIPSVADVFVVLDVGPVVASFVSEPDLDLPTRDASVLASDEPIVAVLDDGIGFLNARFRKPTTGGGFETRFHAVWLQAAERIHAAPNDVAVAHSGITLESGQINAMLNNGVCNEAAIYDGLQDAIYGPEAHRSLSMGRTHGTHILDLAAGADPLDATNPARDWPLLAVQLPPEAIEDTSGARFQSYLVQGVRWILHNAAQISTSQPVILNISLGILAGAKDGSTFAEYQIAREARLWEERTGQPVRVVYSFGNNYRSRQVARFSFDSAAKQGPREASILWRVQPDDLTASYLEIGGTGDDISAAFDINLTAPDGTSSGFFTLGAGHIRSLEKNGAPIARVYRVPARGLIDGHYTPERTCIALAPTAGRVAGEPEAPSGGWTVSLRPVGSDAVTACLQIQRDDSAMGYRVRGRQSYFDSPHGYGWEMDDQDNSGLEAVCAISRQGTHSALVSAPESGGDAGSARQIVSVGAAEWKPAAQEARPSRYSAQGSPDQVARPSVSAIADEGRIAAGLVATGTLTGSSATLGGTSAAAANVSRALAMSAPRIIGNVGDGTTTVLSDFDPMLGPVLAIDPSDEDRLGQLCIGVLGGRRGRRGTVRETEHEIS